MWYQKLVFLLSTLACRLSLSSIKYEGNVKLLFTVKLTLVTYNIVLGGGVIGCSAQIKEQPISHSPHKIRGLDVVYTEYGFYNYDGCSEDYILAPIDGIYMISASLVLEQASSGLDNSIVKFYVVEEGKTSPLYCVAYEEIDSRTQSMSISCFVRLQLHTKLDIILENAKGLKLLSWSTISIQYIGTSGVVPTLIVPISDITRAKNGSWSIRSQGGHLNSLAGKLVLNINRYIRIKKVKRSYFSVLSVRILFS